MADRYSFSLTTFNPRYALGIISVASADDGASGKLVQIEYALNVVNNGVTALGIKGLQTSTV